MAGPGFDEKPQRLFDPKESAKNVQCIHTSADAGTKQRNCHQDWNMGICGYHQIGAKKPPLGSHGLCPIFYNSAFDNNFYAEENPQQCTKVQIRQRYWPENFKMGYMEKRKPYVYGEFYASTTKYYPYTRNLVRLQITDGPITPLDGYKYRLIMILNHKKKLFRKKKELLFNTIAKNVLLTSS